MKILQIASGDFFSTYGGGQVYVKNIVDCMIDMGEDISVISFTSVSAPITKEYKGHTLIELPTNCNLETLRENIVSLNPQVIHAHSRKADVCLAGRELNIPVIITAHHGGIVCPAGSLLNHKDEICYKKINHSDCLPCVLRNTRTGLRLWYPFMRHIPEDKYFKIGEQLSHTRFIPFITPIGIAAWQIKHKTEEWQTIAENASVIVAPSEAIAKSLINNGLEERNVRILPHGIPLPSSRPSFPEIKDGKIKFFYVGRIAYIKGLHILIKAFKQVGNPNIELHIIGGAATKVERRYQKKLKKLSSSDPRINWHGKKSPDKIFDTIKDFHIAISVPLYLEVFGLNIAEALALGKPVIASKSGGPEMQILDGVNGWFLEPNNPNQLKNKIESIIKKQHNLDEQSNNCQASSIETHSKNLNSIYKECQK